MPSLKIVCFAASFLPLSFHLSGVLFVLVFHFLFTPFDAGELLL